MKEAARDWLDLAALDLRAAQRIVGDPDLVPVALFHAQQAVEKALKALLEERALSVPKTHDLERLHRMLDGHFDLPVEEDSLRLLAALYISTRYPVGMGLLPTGRPTRKEGQRLIAFAEDVIGRVRILLAAP